MGETGGSSTLLGWGAEDADGVDESLGETRMALGEAGCVAVEELDEVDDHAALKEEETVADADSSWRNRRSVQIQVGDTVLAAVDIAAAVDARRRTHVGVLGSNLADYSGLVFAMVEADNSALPDSDTGVDCMAELHTALRTAPEAAELDSHSFAAAPGLDSSLTVALEVDLEAF